MKNNWTVMGLFVVAGAIFAIYGVPWLHMWGRVWVAYVVYGLMVVMFLYCRQNVPAVRGSRRGARRSPGQL